ncbi:MAG: apolipoprotein N-acyltransferase [Paracoccaceae bacterium]
MSIAKTLGDLTGKRQLLLALVAGAVLGLVQAPWSFPLAFLLAIPVLFWLHSGAEGRWRATLIGWWGGFGYFALTLSWIVEPFMVDAARDGWMAPFALVLIACILALSWGLAFGIAKRGNLLALAIFWTLMELGRAYVLTGFPWGLLAYGWADTPVMQMAALIGVHGTAFLTLLAVMLLADRRWITGGAILLMMWGFGSYRLSQTPPPAASLTVRIVQPNAAQHLKWLPEFASVFYERHLELSRASSPLKPDIIIWPEAAVPFIPARRPDLMQQIAQIADGAVILLGARRIDEAGNWYNGMVLLDQLGNIVDSYDKYHLAPFGEYVPFASILSKTGIKALTGGAFTPGSGPKTLSDGHIPPFLPLICYEAIFPQHARVNGPRPDWIVQITNDAWFGQFSGPYQHLIMARVRAIEQGLPLARSANTGISAVIDPFGRIIKALPLGEQGYIDAALPAPLPQTLYGRFGDWPMGIFLLALGIWQYFAAMRRKP